MESIEIHAEITNKCILKCKHCSSIANTNDKELELYEFGKFIEKISGDKKIKLTLTGGEPLLRDSLEELLQSIKELNKDIKVGLFTTGLIKDGSFIESVGEDRINRLKELGLNFVYVSIYSNNGIEHDNITQENLSFNKTIVSINRFVNAGIETNINMPLMKSNIDKLGDIIKYLRNIDVNEIRLLRLINHGIAEKNWNEIGLTKEEQLKAIDRIKQNLDDKISFGGFLEIMSCQYITKDKRCLAGKNKLYIDNNGDVYPCGAVKLNRKTKICTIYESFDIESYNKSGGLCLAFN